MTGAGHGTVVDRRAASAAAELGASTRGNADAAHVDRCPGQAGGSRTRRPATPRARTSSRPTRNASLVGSTGVSLSADAAYAAYAAGAAEAAAARTRTDASAGPDSDSDRITRALRNSCAAPPR